MTDLPMNDDRLLQRLKGLDTPIEPSPRFGDELFGTLVRERRAEGGRRFRIEPPQLLQMAAASAAVLLIVAVGWALLANPRGPAITPLVIPSASPTPSEASPTPTQELPSADPTLLPSPSRTPLFPSEPPFPTPSLVPGAWQPRPEPPYSIAGYLDSNDGTVYAFGYVEEPAPYTPNELTLMSYDTGEWSIRGRITYEAVGLDPNHFPGVYDAAGDIYLFGSSPDATSPPVVWRIDGGTLTAEGTGPEVSSPTVTVEIAPDGTIYVLDTYGADTPEWTAERLWTYDPVADEFEQLPEIPQDRVGAMLIADAAGGVNVIGGSTVPEFTRPDTAEWDRLDTAFRYDSTAGEWSDLPALPNPAGTDLNLVPYTNLATLGSDGALYVATTMEGQRLQRLANGATDWSEVDFPQEITGNPYWIGLQTTTGDRLVLVGTPDQLLIAAETDLSQIP